jgi:hypothetical protein
MLPFHNDFLAKVGQFPFYVLAGLSLYQTARALHLPQVACWYTPLCFWSAHEIAAQAINADVDLFWTAFFLCTLLFLVRLMQEKSPAEAVLLGICLGIYLGSKYAALVFLPVFLIPLAYFCLTQRQYKLLWWIAPGTLLLSGYWYLRNAWLTGSPIYPASLEILASLWPKGLIAGRS